MFNRSSGILSLTILLVSAHYGLGFILGTAEQAITIGAAGSLYAVSLGLGFLALLALVKFYWHSVDQIWTLLGNRYGTPVKIGVALMSWTSLIGIEAVQIIAASDILGITGFSKLPSMIGLAMLFCLLSLLPVERASQIFRGLLLFNIGALLYALWRLHSFSELALAPLQFLPSLYQVDWRKGLGISLPTILLVMIDMKCQQFIVQARTVRTAYWGCILAAIALIGLAFLPTAVVMAAQHQGILPETLTGKETIPYVLSWLGGGAHQWQGVLWILALAIPALGIGSNILRIQTKTILDLNVIPNFPYNRVLVAILNALFAFGIALKGGEIVNLILDFYAAYLSCVWIPFAAYLLAYTKRYIFSQTSVRLSLLVSAIASLLTLGITLFHPIMILFNSTELTIVTIGIGLGSLSLLLTQVIETYWTTSNTQEKVQ
jgi:solute:Na+ symporter, SSS family